MRRTHLYSSAVRHWAVPDQGAEPAVGCAGRALVPAYNSGVYRADGAVWQLAHIAVSVRRDFLALHCGSYEFGRVPMHRIAGRVKRSEAHCDDGSAAYMGRGICGNHRFMDQSRKILKHEPIKAKFLAAGSVRSCRHGVCQSLPAGPIPTDGLCGYHRGSANTVTCDGHDGFVSAESMVLREAHGRVN